MPYTERTQFNYKFLDKQKYFPKQITVYFLALIRKEEKKKNALHTSGSEFTKEMKSLSYFDCLNLAESAVRMNKNDLDVSETLVREKRIFH